MKSAWPLLFILSIALLLVASISSPSATAHISVRENSWKSQLLPLLSSSEETSRFIIKLSSKSPIGSRSYWLRADDCVEQLKIDDELQSVEPICSFPDPINLRLNFKSQNQEIKVTGLLKNKGGRAGLWLDTSRDDKTYLTVVILAPLAIYLITLSYLKKHFTDEKRLLLSFGAFGSLLRFYYFLFIPYWQYSYDAEEHLDYILMIANNLTIPSPHQGWQFYQNPLYYIMAALLFRFARFIDFPAVLSIQILSLALSLITFWAILGIVKNVLKRKSVGLVLAYVVTSIAPLLIMPTSRISNDTLTMCLASLSVLAVVKSVTSGSYKLSYLSIALASLSILSKSSALPILLANLLFFALKKGVNKPHILKQALLALIIISPIAIRNIYHQESGIVGKDTISAINPQLSIEPSKRNFLSFDLRRVLETPFNQSYGDNYGKNNFFEYFLLSSISGEFKILKEGLVSTSIIVGLLIILSLSTIGSFSCLRRDASLERYLLLLFLLSFTALLIFTTSYPLSPTQEARHIPWITITVAVFAGSGLNILKPLYDRYRKSRNLR